MFLDSYLLIISLILYFYRYFIFKKCVLFLFRNGNICILEKKHVIDCQNRELKVETKELLNVGTPDATENVILYVTDSRFYELFFLYGERGLGEAWVKEYCFTEELEGLINIVHNIFQCPVYKYWITFYRKIESCFHKHFHVTPITYSLDPIMLETYPFKDFSDAIFFTDDKSLEDLFSEEINRQFIIQDHDFENTFIEQLFPGKFVCRYQDIERVLRLKKRKIHHLERLSNDTYLESIPKEITQITSKESYHLFCYYTTYLRFLFKNEYLSVNKIFCKK